jgi:hypothetical protein
VLYSVLSPADVEGRDPSSEHLSNKYLVEKADWRAELPRVRSPHEGSPKAHNSLRSAMDPLDKCFAVFLPPKRGCLQQIHRRVDLIIAPYKYYFTAIVGWTGSTMFERDLRRWVDAKGMKFHSGGLSSFCLLLIGLTDPLPS